MFIPMTPGSGCALPDFCGPLRFRFNIWQMEDVWCRQFVQQQEPTSFLAHLNNLFLNIMMNKS